MDPSAGTSTLGFVPLFETLDEIRGAGSILGEVQTGHIAAVGFDLYTELVAEAVSELEGREPGQLA